MTKRNSDGGPTTARKRRRLTSASVDGAAIPANAYGGVLQFRHAWKNLRKAGWTSKPPSGGQSLDCRYRYIRPCGNPRGVEGEDYLLGEDAVLRYVETQAVCREEAAATMKGADGTGKTLKAMRSRLETLLVLMAMAEVVEVDEKEGLLRSVVVASARARWRVTTTWYLCKPQKGERRMGRRRVRRHSMRHPEA
ncbi:hypothetical protein PRIC1_003096 [Phytophthora ramorum]